MPKSFHDLQQATHDDVVKHRLTRVHGVPVWSDMIKISKEVSKIACKYKVSHDWSGNYGLLALVIGAAKYAARYPNLPAYVQPTQPPAGPTIQNGSSAVQQRNLIDAHELLTRDWAVVCGFVSGIGEIIRAAFDEDIFDTLNHVVTGFIDVWPRQYFELLEREYCPLDEAAYDAVKGDYERGWDRANNERITKFAERLDEEQAAHHQDGVTITDAEKYRHYIGQIYKSGAFSEETIMEWTAQGAANHNYANARTFFEDKWRAREKVQRLTGNTTGGLGFGTAMAAQDFQRLAENIGEQLKDSIRTSVSNEIHQQCGDVTRITEQANAIRSLTNENTSLKAKIDNLTKLLTSLKSDVAKLAANSAEGPARDGGTVPTGGGNKGGEEDFGTWTKSLRFDHKWPGAKKKWWHNQFKKLDPAGYKEHNRKRLQAQMDRLDRE